MNDYVQILLSKIYHKHHLMMENTYLWIHFIMTEAEKMAGILTLNLSEK